jgi:hypothetical protein
MGPRPTTAFAAQPTRCTACPAGTGGSLCVVHKPVRPARVQRLLGALECTQERTRLARHSAEHARSTVIARPAASAQRPNIRKVLFYGLIATPRTGWARRCGQQGTRAGLRRGGGSHRCAAAVLGGSGSHEKLTMPRKASLRWVGPPRPAGEERGKPVRSGDGESVTETGVGAAASLLTDRKLVVQTICREGGCLYTRVRHRR